MTFTGPGARRVKTAVGVGGLLGLALTRGVNIIMNKVLCQEKMAQKREQRELILSEDL